MNKHCVLTINGGSSSIKFSLYEIKETLTQLFFGGMENINTQSPKLSFTNAETNEKNDVDVTATNHDAAVNELINWLEKQQGFADVKAIGHRIVHGMKHTEPEKISRELLEELKKIAAYDPEHLPEEIKLIEIFAKRYPDLQQVACFDTSFHTTMPPVAKLLPIPRKYYNMGVQRYGFHGLSYAYLVQELEKNKAATGKVILAHLGSGASLAAVKDGKSVDTSMGFTPTAGIPMGTRTGDLDPGVAWYLMQSEKLDSSQFSRLINHESGLLGVSETSADMRELMKNEQTDSRAADAIALFCYQTKKWIGSFAAVLGGLETLVFSGGIGEHTPEVRSRVCEGLQFLGIELDKAKNAKNEKVISSDGSKVVVMVIPTNEELMIARLVSGLLDFKPQRQEGK